MNEPVGIIKSIQNRYTGRANPRRGYHDSECIVTFYACVTEAEQKAAMAEIQKEKAAQNMWAYGPKKVAANVWQVNFGYDSGD